MQIKVYLSDLAKYNIGRENGKWLTLPMEHEMLKDIVKDMCGEHEYIILDYDASFPISEYENIFVLNQFMENINDSGLDETELKILSMTTDCREDLEDVIESGCYTIVNVDDVADGWIVPEHSSERYGLVLNEVGYNTLFSQPVPEEMVDYIDWESIYRDLSINDGWKQVTINGNDYLVTTRF